MQGEYFLKTSNLSSTKREPATETTVSPNLPRKENLAFKEQDKSFPTIYIDICVNVFFRYCNSVLQNVAVLRRLAFVAVFNMRQNLTERNYMIASAPTGTADTPPLARVFMLLDLVERELHATLWKTALMKSFLDNGQG